MRVFGSRAEKRQLAKFDELPALTQMALLRELNLLPNYRNAQEYLTYIAAATALTASQVAFMGPILSVPQDPLVLCFAYIPTITTVTATSTLTFNINRTDTPAVIGGGVVLAPTGGTKAGPLTLMAVVPFGIPAGSGISVSGSDSSATAIPTGSATQPMILALLGLS
jgi:hypothetical protein